MESLLVLLRHGESVWNHEKRFTGQTDIDLNFRGREQAIQAGELLRSVPFRRTYSSSLKRAYHTAELVLQSAGQNLTVERYPQLNERNYGILQGMLKTDAEKHFGREKLHRWQRSWEEGPPNGESLKKVAGRVVPFYVNRIAPSLETGNVLVTAHANSLRSLIMHVEQISPEAIEEVRVENAIPTVYRVDTGRAVSKWVLTPEAPLDLATEEAREKVLDENR